MKVFERYYKSTLKASWKAGGDRKKTRSSYALKESDEAMVQGYNAIWQPAVEYVETKLSEMPPGNSNEKLYFEALLGVLQSNKISVEDKVDAVALRQKIDGLVSKVSSLKSDAPSGDLQDYLMTFISGMNSFHNQIPVDSPEQEPQDAPEPEAEPAPEQESEPNTEKDKAEGDEEAAGGKPNSREELLQSLGFRK